MKTRNLFNTILALLVLFLGIALIALSAQRRQPARVFPATVNRDCAPWDGSAFTLSLRYDAVTTITVSIWKSPSFLLPVTFSFPDETMRLGTAYSVKEVDPLEMLTGRVTFQRVEQGIPIEGRFSFTSAGGEAYDGKFVAEWGSQQAYCG